MEQTIRRYQSPYRTGGKKNENTEKLLKYWSKFVIQTIISAVILMCFMYCENVNAIATSAVWTRATNIIESDISVDDMKNTIQWGIEYIKIAVPEILANANKHETLSRSSENISAENNIKSKEDIEIEDYTKDMTQEQKDIYSILSVMTILRPVNGEISSPYGDRTDPLTNEYGLHTGIDYSVPVGTQIKSAISGTVVEVKKSNVSLGNYVKVKNSDIITTYAHCSGIKVKEGDKVRQGDIIALSGNTGKSSGPHLHFEITKGGRYIDPVKLTG